jgi:hypothetical protein
VGVLPQGLAASSRKDPDRFDVGDPDTYIAEVLKLAAPDIQKKLPSANAPAAPKPTRVIASGHSGGGRPAIAAAHATAKKGLAAGDDAWIAGPRLFLFDGIHDDGQVRDVIDVLRIWVKEDVAILSKAPDPQKLLDRRGLKFRSSYSTGSWFGYTAWNVGGTWKEKKLGADNKPVIGPDDKPVMVEKKVSRANSLRGQIDALFAKEAKSLGALGDKLKEAHYVVLDKAEPGVHERTVGVGGSPEDRREKREKAPAGLTGEAAKAGVPKYGGGGNLEKALGGLPSDLKVSPPKPPTSPPVPLPPKSSALEPTAEDADAAYA